MSLYRRKDSPFWWVKLPLIRGDRSLYSKALGLPTSVKRSRSATSPPSPVGNKTGLA